MTAYQYGTFGMEPRVITAKDLCVLAEDLKRLSVPDTVKLITDACTAEVSEHYNSKQIGLKSIVGEVAVCDFFDQRANSQLHHVLEVLLDHGYGYYLFEGRFFLDKQILITWAPNLNDYIYRNTND